MKRLLLFETALIHILSVPAILLMDCNIFTGYSFNMLIRLSSKISGNIDLQTCRVHFFIQYPFKHFTFPQHSCLPISNQLHSSIHIRSIILSHLLIYMEHLRPTVSMSRGSFLFTKNDRENE